MAKENTLVLERISKRYKDAGQQLVVLDQLSYSFAAGRSVAILGRSGVGKSTLLHILGGLDRPSSGRVLIGSTDLTALNDRELTEYRGGHIGFIFQFHHLLPEFSAVENVAMPLIIKGECFGSACEVAHSILDRVGLADRARHLPGQLSGGEQQRVAIARSLVTKPQVLLADEPTGNLDLVTATKVREVLLSVQKESGITLIVVTHSRELAAYLDDVVEMGVGGSLERVQLA